MRWLAVLLWICLPHVLLAEVIPVQVGALDQRTRVVLSLPAGAAWAVQDTENSASITVDTATGFDAERADFSFAGSRLSEISPGESTDTLTLAFNCDCAAESFLINDRFLIIDIVDRPALSNLLPLEETFAGLVQPWHTPLTRALPILTAPETRSPAPPAQSGLDSAIPQGLAQATYQGFLNLRDATPPDDTPDISADALASIAVGIESQLRTLTEGDSILSSAPTFDCKDVSARLIDSWDTDVPFNLQLATLRSRIAEDDLDPRALEALAIALVGHGLGLEAQVILANLRYDSDLIRALGFIAQVIDDPQAPALVGLETCSEDLSFWSFLIAAHDAGMTADQDPQRLMMTYKLLPPALQSRLVIPFSDALTQAGHRAYLAELQDFKNTALASTQEDPTTAPEVIDFTAPAPAREILRADLTESDFDPAVNTSRNPVSLDLPVLDTLRIERRATPSEAVLLDEVLRRHVEDGSYFVVVDLLIDSQSRLSDEDYTTLSDRHLGASIAAMTEPELLAFAFRSSLPDLTDEMKEQVRSRLMAMGISPPDPFAQRVNRSPSPTPQPVEPEVLPAPQTLPVLIQAPRDAIPTFAESERLLEGSAAIRNAIETLLAETDP